jgi:hypothetical protein
MLVSDGWRFGDLPSRFFVLWWSGVFAGVFGEMRVSVWCFCGEVVVECVVNVVSWPTLFGG